MCHIKTVKKKKLYILRSFIKIKTNKEILRITGKIIKIEKANEARCNKVYFLTTKNNKYVLKVAIGNSRQKELEKEISIINSISKKIKQPQILLQKQEDKYSYVLMEFINGNKPTNFSEEILKQLALCLKTIHSFKIDQKKTNYKVLLDMAEENIANGKPDMDEFVIDNNFVQPQALFDWLKTNMPKSEFCFLHGDFRPKNMIISGTDLYIIDWGLSFCGDPYYDLSIIKEYFTDEQFNKFIRYYGIKNINKERLDYNDKLSKFLNV